jgi:hypothetical protein
VIEIAITVVIPMVVMLAAAALAVPIAFKKSLSIVMGRHPMRRCIGRTAPISVVPPISVSDCIPVPIDPKIIGAGAGRNHSYYTRWRRRPNSHSDRNLGKSRSEDQ